MDFSIELQSSAGELRPQHNNPGETSTRENALEYDPDECTLINVRIETAQYGVYDGEAAALIIFRFHFKFRTGSRRIRNFNVQIDFRGNGTNAGVPGTSHPKIKTLAPEERRGKIFTEERSNTTTAGAEVPLGPSGATINVSEEMARKINREYELRLNGWKKSSDAAVDNLLIWDCVEARKAAKGVVPGYKGAVVVQYPKDQPFSATFKLDAERGVFNFKKSVFDYLNVFGKKEKDDPVIFNPASPIGHQYPHLGDFKDLNLDDYIILKPIETLPSGFS